MSECADPDGRIVYCCHACEFRFAATTPGAATCPRCRAIGDHHRVDADAPATGGP